MIVPAFRRRYSNAKTTCISKIARVWSFGRSSVGSTSFDRQVSRGTIFPASFHCSRVQTLRAGTPAPGKRRRTAVSGGAASYSKALPHDFQGEPIQGTYSKFLAALSEGRFAALEAITLSGAAKLSNPLAGNAYDLEGLDSCQFTIPAPPTCSSAEQAAEMAELYWQALVWDVPFSRWEPDAAIGAAVADLSTISCPAAPQNTDLRPSACSYSVQSLFVSLEKESLKVHTFRSS